MEHSNRAGPRACMDCSRIQRHRRMEMESRRRADRLPAHPPACLHPHPQHTPKARLTALHNSTFHPRRTHHTMEMTATSSSCHQLEVAVRTSTASQAAALAQLAVQSARGFPCADDRGTRRHGWRQSAAWTATGSAACSTYQWSGSLGSSQAASVVAQRRESRWRTASTCSARASSRPRPSTGGISAPADNNTWAGRHRESPPGYAWRSAVSWCAGLLPQRRRTQTRRWRLDRSCRQWLEVLEIHWRTAEIHQ